MGEEWQTAATALSFVLSIAKKGLLARDVCCVHLYL
jgi:hypothetical protein